MICLAAYLEHQLVMRTITLRTMTSPMLIIIAYPVEITRIAVNLLLAEDHAVGYDSSPLRTCFDKFPLLHWVIWSQPTLTVKVMKPGAGLGTSVVSLENVYRIDQISIDFVSAVDVA